jgi:hypothetical protein
VSGRLAAERAAALPHQRARDALTLYVCAAGWARIEVTSYLGSLGPLDFAVHVFRESGLNVGARLHAERPTILGAASAAPVKRS